ncbi:MAG: exopolysaccharide biosynthesis polyprenyl glycosylphosphotransferase [Candidatus Saccharibacteria bacterium]
MKNNASLVYNACLIVGDFLALVAAFVAAYILRVKLDPRPLIEPIHALSYLGIFLTVLPFWILIFAWLGLYNSNIYEKRFVEFGRLVVGSFIGLLFLVFWNFVSKTPIFPARLVPIYGFTIAFALLIVYRNLLRYVRTTLFKYSVGLTRVVIVGDTAITGEIVESLLHNRSGYHIVAIISNKQFAQHALIPSFKTFKEFLKTEPLGLHGIIQTELFSNEGRNAEILTYAQKNHITYRFVPGNTELFVGNIEVELFRSSLPVIVVRQTAIFGWGRIVKRISDLILGGILLLLASPFMLIIAAFVKASDGGDIFFRQKRLTRYNQTFGVYKFRTLITKYNGLDPEEAFVKMGRPELVKEYRDNGDQIPNDPRFSRIGRFLRATSLDEVPQLINVVKGDISLVGPRALIPRELAEYSKRHTILSVKSGITGLAQVSGRRDISFDERRKLDLYYVQNWSLWLDIVILAKTLRSVFARQGAR